MPSSRPFTAFAGHRLVASGPIETVLREAKPSLDRDEAVLFFDDATGKQVDFDTRGTADEAVARLRSHPLFLEAPRSGPGRPKLGVVSREVTLLPRHWDWLEQQPQGLSAALRLLVDEARHREPDKAQAQAARNALAKMMWSLAGDLPGFEEASRALFAKDQPAFERLVQAWPKDLKALLRKRSRAAAALERPLTPAADRPL